MPTIYRMGYQLSEAGREVPSPEPGTWFVCSMMVPSRFLVIIAIGVPVDIPKSCQDRVHLLTVVETSNLVCPIVPLPG